MPPSSGTVEAVASWIRQSFIEDFGEDSASRVASVINDNDLSLRVLRSLSHQDIAELFPFFSFGQKRTFSILLDEANGLASPSYASPSLAPQTSITSPRKKQKVAGKSYSIPDAPNPPRLRHDQLDEVDGLASSSLAPHTSITSPRGKQKAACKSYSIPGTPNSSRIRHDHLDEVDSLASPPLTPQASLEAPHKRHEAVSRSLSMYDNPLSTQSRLTRVNPCNEFFVCIVGPSGVWKSTTLNAILDGHQVLPTSSMRASTAVPIEIRYKESATKVNNIESDTEELPFERQYSDEDISQFTTTQASEDKRFMAEIEFISEQDWKDYITRAVSLLQRKRSAQQKLRGILGACATNALDDGADRTAMEHYCRSNIDEEPSEAAALSAVRSVLGESNFATMEQVRSLGDKPKIAAILKHLGQSLRFSFDKPLDVSRRIERFLATGVNRRSAAAWPLVKSARIYGPWKMLSAGMVLVDLPGLQDANAARNKVVSSYIHRCHAIITAAKISRARDNKTTNDLLTGPIRRGIESGRVKYVAFIATHSDDINPEEIIEDLHVSFSRNVREGLQQAQALDHENDLSSFIDVKRQVSRLQQLRTSSHRLTQLNDSWSDDCLIDRQHKIEELSKGLRSTCIVARNGFVSQALKDQFVQEMGNIQNVPTLSVFCVSSTQYVSIMREDCADISRDFADIRLTGIPSLSDSLWSLSRTTQPIRVEGQSATRAAFRPSRACAVIDEPPVENAEELRGFLRSVLEEFGGEDDADAEKIRADMEEIAQKAMVARESALSDAKKRMQSRYVYLEEIIALNKKAADTLLKVLKRCRNSSVSIASDRRVEMWLDQASDHTKEAKAKGAMIAILGDSGSGKSSLLNALLGSDGEDVLPVSGVRACTAAPIAITYCGSGGFHAEIEFLGVQEWHKELVSDLEEATKTRLKNKMPYFERPRSELGKMAYDKILSVYGRIASYQGLIDGNHGVENRLGTTAKVHDFSAKGIRRKLEAFCSSKPDDSSDSGERQDEAGHLWPLVRVAHLKGPFKALSDSGGCLLDLPGLQDSNSARNAVVQSYLGSCSGFIITAPIKRAVDNQTARDLLGRQFRRQLLLDGRINSVAFAATQADDIDALQVASELGLHGVSSYSGVPELEVKAKFSKHAVKIARMRKGIKGLAKRKRDLKSRLRREELSLDQAKARALTTTSDSDAEYYCDGHERGCRRQQNRITNLEYQLSEIEISISGMTAELAKREHVLNHICSLARNEYCRIQVREDFVEGIQEITDGAFANSDGQTDSTHRLPVFTTSSNDFRFLNQKQTEQAKTFYTVDETGVPRLFQFVRHNMLVSRINAEYARTERLSVLLSSLQQYLLMKDRASMSQQNALAGEVGKLLSGIDKSTAAICSQAIDKLNRVLLEGPMKKTLILGGIKARENASANLGRVEDSLHWATYRACLRRFGVYVSPTAGAMNMNESLMAPLMETVIPNWREAFGTGVSRILQTFVTNAIRLADTTLATVAKKVALFGLSAAPLEGAGELRSIAKKSFDMAICEARTCMEKEFGDLQRNCWQQLPPSVVQKSLKPGYTKANDESGPGCVARPKDHMRHEVRIRRSVMFDKCVQQINAAVNKVLHEVGAVTNSKLKSYFVCLLDDIEVLWDSKCDIPYEKCVCLASALKNLTGLVDKIRIGSLALKKSIDGVDYNSPDSARSVLPVLNSTVELASMPLIDELLLDDIIPKQRNTSYWANAKRENQLYNVNMSGAFHGKRSQVLSANEPSSAGESFSGGKQSASDEGHSLSQGEISASEGEPSVFRRMPSPHDTESDEWPVCF